MPKSRGFDRENVKNKPKTQRVDDVPDDTMQVLSENAAIYGGTGTTIMVAAEILIRQKKPIRLCYKAKGKKQTRFITLRPRAIELLSDLTPVYGTRGEVVMACAEVLRKKDKT